MKKILPLLSLIIIAYSPAKAQEWFLGKTERVIKDSMFKIGYYQFYGLGFPNKQYNLQFKYYDFSFLSDTARLKALKDTSNAIIPYDLPQHDEYNFLFQDDVCISLSKYFRNLDEYAKMKTYLDTQYKNVPDNWPGEKKWIDEVDVIYIYLKKETVGFAVFFQKSENPALPLK